MMTPRQADASEILLFRDRIAAAASARQPKKRQIHLVVTNRRERNILTAYITAYILVHESFPHFTLKFHFDVKQRFYRSVSDTELSLHTRWSNEAPILKTRRKKDYEQSMSDGRERAY